MTSDKKIASNQANAGKSTGPKSSAGKATSAQNAKTHGLTTPPDRTDVLRWVRILSGNPEQTLDALEHDDGDRPLLALARAEARLERACKAERHCAAELAKYTATRNQPDPFALDLEDLDDPAVLQLLLKGRWGHTMRETIRALLRSSAHRLPELQKRLDNIQRYVRQAERQKRVAFRDWIRAERRICKTNSNTL
jgi:hypothetical protein